ncbi:putative transporter YisQ [Clostridium bornimense]|uniref:Putative transporter YisQ n=1 Tax=Clostridium bornimense TaxID=1216932 RepID=W6SFD7_9CLOT|nr:MATE family efflux transporter [Clostridium bornimense]CDM68390.1 putative transporter YisQ [Clostridium bornimense]
MQRDKTIKRKLFNYTWPIFIESVLLSFLGSMDVFMLGKFSDNAVAAVGVSNQIIWMFSLMFGIITSGTSILTAQYIGANKKNKSSNNDNIIRLCGVSICFNTLIGIFCSGLVVVGSTVMLKMLNTSEEILGIGKEYLVIVGGFIFTQSILQTFTAILRPHGYTKVCMYVTLIMNITNVICNYIFIFGKFGVPELGAVGAAIGTSTSRIIGMIILGIVLYVKILRGNSLKCIKVSPEDDLKNILAIGIPAAGEQISYNLSQLVITSFINMISINAMATKSYAMNLISFAYIFSTSLGQGTSILVGQLVGEDKNDEALNIGINSIKKSILVSVLISGVFALFGSRLMSLFSNNAVIIEMGALVLIIDVFLEPGRSINLVGINSLRAAGDVKFPVYIGIISMWIFGVGLAYILGIQFKLGLIGMWIAFAIDEWFRGILVYNRWKKRRWQGKAFTNEVEADAC